MVGIPPAARTGLVVAATPASGRRFAAASPVAGAFVKPMRVLLLTAADDPAQHAVSGDGVPDGLSAPARGAARARGRAGRRGARAVPAAVLPRGARRASLAPRCSAHGGASRRRRSSRFLAHAERYVDDGRAVVRFLQGRDPGLALRIAGARLPARGAALRAAGAGAARRRRDADDPLGLGVRRARRRGPRQAPREPLRRRPRRRDPRRHRRRASSCRATPSGWPPARRRSIRCATRSRARRRWSTSMLDEIARELAARHRPDWSA